MQYMKLKVPKTNFTKTVIIRKGNRDLFETLLVSVRHGDEKKRLLKWAMSIPFLRRFYPISDPLFNVLTKWEINAVKYFKKNGFWNLNGPTLHAALEMASIAGDYNRFDTLYEAIETDEESFYQCFEAAICSSDEFFNAIMEKVRQVTVRMISLTYDRYLDTRLRRNDYSIESIPNQYQAISNVDKRQCWPQLLRHTLCTTEVLKDFAKICTLTTFLHLMHLNLPLAIDLKSLIARRALLAFESEICVFTINLNLLHLSAAKYNDLINIFKSIRRERLLSLVLHRVLDVWGEADAETGAVLCSHFNKLLEALMNQNLVIPINIYHGSILFACFKYLKMKRNSVGFSFDIHENILFLRTMHLGPDPRLAFQRTLLLLDFELSLEMWLTFRRFLNIALVDLVGDFHWNGHLITPYLKPERYKSWLCKPSTSQEAVLIMSIFEFTKSIDSFIYIALLDWAGQNNFFDLIRMILCLFKKESDSAKYISRL